VNKPPPQEPPTDTSEPNEESTTENEEILDGEVTPKAEAPVIGVPTDAVFKSAFLAALKYKSIQSAIKAYNGAILETANTEKALGTLDLARLEAQKAVQTLMNAPKIHETDQLHRDISHLDAQQRLKQMKHEAELAEMERAAEMRHATKAFENEEVKSDLTEEERELVDALLAKMKPDRYRAILEKTIREQNFTGADEAKARQILDELIKRSL
jgi:hypothetical protein